MILCCPLVHMATLPSGMELDDNPRARLPALFPNNGDYAGADTSRDSIRTDPLALAASRAPTMQRLLGWELPKSYSSSSN